MSRWFRLYDDMLDDPKVQKLQPVLFKVWVNLLCLASKNGGSLPSMEDTAFALRTDEAVLKGQIDDLLLRGLIDAGDEMKPHNWDVRQFKSDHDETAADRQRAKRLRDKEKPVTRDESVTSHPPEAEQIQKQSQNIADQSTTDAGRTAACVEIGKRVTDLMGVTDDPRWLGNWSTVTVWLSQGWDAELDILPTVAATVDKLKRSSKPMPGSLKYFTRAIEENHRARIATGESPAQKTTREFFSVKKGSPAHRAWMAYYRSQGRKMAFYEKQEVLPVPTEYPPPKQEAAA